MSHTAARSPSRAMRTRTIGELSAIERADHLRPALGLLALPVGHVEADAVEQAVVLRLDLAGDLVPRAGHREDVEHLVGDEIRHAAPVAGARLVVELRL